MKCMLPNELKFNHPVDLIRLGKNYDGGYLVSKSDVNNTNFLIGLGLNDDWSFEEHFQKINFVPTVIYDASVNSKFFLKLFIMNVINLLKPKKIFHGLSTYIKYKRFFKHKAKHIKKFVGLDALGPYCTMNNIFKKYHYDNIFLKIDIEGCEYRILKTLLENSNKLTGCVIEFHDCDINLDKIIEFSKNFDLEIIHIHANNYAPIRNLDLLPTVLEISYSSSAKSSGNYKLPHSLDMNNNPIVPELEISFGD